MYSVDLWVATLGRLAPDNETIQHFTARSNSTTLRSLARTALAVHTMRVCLERLGASRGASRGASLRASSGSAVD